MSLQHPQSRFNGLEVRPVFSTKVARRHSPSDEPSKATSAGQKIIGDVEELRLEIIKSTVNVLLETRCPVNAGYEDSTRVSELHLALHLSKHSFY